MPDFTLRPWAMDDLDSLVRNANNSNIARFMMDIFPYPYRRENGVAFLEFTAQHNPIRMFAIDIKGEAAGGIGVHPQQDILKKNAELGYWLAEKYWGQGIMTAAIGQMVKYAFDTFEIDRLFARIFGNNIPSQKIIQKAGFKLEASFDKTLFKNGEYLDELIYGIRRTD